MRHFMVITQKFGQLYMTTTTKKMAFVILSRMLTQCYCVGLCQASSYALIWLVITIDWRIVKVPSISFDLFVPNWHHVSHLLLKSNLFQLIKMHCLHIWFRHTLTHTNTWARARYSPLLFNLALAVGQFSV